ncbi:hypothetical protein THRCLA_00752 [Thraustotheca clavata]|uniref:Aminoglycoside phosphotransferase domain-containing protein n=1 Tax=Thraustotheca clavata TaxID=74557 RepID=A0A1W0AAC2_9STRA|nr:hypothetical protein THRCLA_00752 [Thraustotheca clavata]
MDFSDSNQVINYFNRSKYSNDENKKALSAIMLSGGTVNYVWRLVFTDNTTAILKQFPASLRSNPNFALPQVRSNLEYEALCIVEDQLPKDSTWHAPTPYFFDENHHVILCQDMKGESLFDLLKRKGSINNDMEWIAKTLVQIPRDIAGFSVSNISMFENSPLIPIMNGLYARNPARAIELGLLDGQAWFDRAVATESSATRQLLHGDYWPASVLIDLQEKKIALVDWELARTGHPGCDFGQMLANIALMGESQAYDHEEAKKLMQEMMSEWQSTDGFDLQAAYIKRIIQLSNVSHWHLDDTNAIIQKLVKASSQLNV